jgi:hypothetical protein
MAWERRRKGLFYYRARRDDDGKVVKEYIGSGLRAEFAASLDAERRLHHEQERQDLCSLQDRLRSLDDATRTLEDGSQQLMAAVLYAGGCYQHNGGQWRRRQDARPEAREA